MKTILFSLFYFTAFSLSSYSQAMTTTIQSKDRTVVQFVKIEITPSPESVDKDVLKYFWCENQNTCSQIGKANGYTRKELAEKYQSLKDSSFYKNLAGGGAALVAVVGGGFLAFAAVVGGAPVAAVVISAITVGGSYVGVRINPKWDPFIAYKKKNVVSPEILQTNEFITPMKMNQFKYLLEQVLQ